MIFRYWLEHRLPVVCAVSVRKDGVSPRPYHTLNMAYHVGDDRRNVAENRRRFFSELEIDLNTLVVGHQVHGDKIEVVDGSFAGCGAYSHEDALPDTDGMITASPSVTLAVLTADCVPVMIFDPIRKAIGISHAGWRGVLSMISAKTVRKMQDVFGINPADCLIAMGPSIGQCCYEVSDDVFSEFKDAFGSTVVSGESNIDLQKAIEIQLANIGVEKGNISSKGLCTSCNLDLFYSHRAEQGITGRMMSVIKLSNQT